MGMEIGEGELTAPLWLLDLISLAGNLVIELRYDVEHRPLP